MSAGYAETIQSQPAAFTVVLTYEHDNSPVTTAVYTDLVVKYSKFGGSSLEVQLDGTLTHLGEGIYKLSFTSDQLDTLGNFVFVVDGGSTLDPTPIRPVISQVVVIAEDDPPSVPPVTLPTCTLTGTILDLGNSPMVNTPVVVKIIDVPTLLVSAGISDTSIAARTNVDGYFSVIVVQGAKIDVSIPEMNYRRKFIVPDIGTQDLFALP